MFKYRFFALSLIAFSLCQTNLHSLTTLNVTKNTDSNVAQGGDSGELRYVLNTIMNRQSDIY